MDRKLFTLIATLILSFCLAVSSFGQSDRGSITGIVSDSKGSVVPGATVIATNMANNISIRTTSTGDGVFTIPALTAGNYRVRIEVSGFKVAEQSPVVVAAGSTARVDVTLQPGQISEVLEISTGPAQLQTENAKITTQVSNKLVDELPLVVGGAVRSPFDLANITPEAKNLGDSAFVVGGGQAGAWGITLDGVTSGTGRFGSVQWANVNAPSLDAITEFTVDTNGYKAEFGRGSGGIMTFTSKSGTNSLHGTVYEFVRNNAFDARRFFETQRGVYKQHDFGFSVGGPIWIPEKIFGPVHYDGRNKSFFFVTGEWFRNRIGAASERFSVPTPEMYSGDFSKWVDENGNLIPIYDPATTRTVNGVNIRDRFPGNIIPQNRISTFARNLLNVTGILQPNSGAAPGTSAYVRNNYINNIGTLLDPWTKWSLKLDHSFSEKSKVSYFYNRGEHLQLAGPDGFPGLPGVFHNFPRNINQTSRSHRGNWTYVIRPTIVNYFYAGFTRFIDNNVHPNAIGGWQGKGICLANAFDCDENFPQINFSDFSTWGGPAADGSENNVYAFGDDLTITRGSHTFKVGYLYERVHYFGFGRQSVSGLIGANRLTTSVPGNSNILTGGGNSFASFLLGEAFDGGTENRRYVRQQFPSHSMYFQDDWKLTPKLTINYGVRYEFTLPPIETDDKWSDFTPDKPNPRAGGIPGALRFAGFGEGRENSRTLVDGWYGGIGPRFGFAYGLDNKTVIRGSVSRTFGMVKATTGSTHFEGAITIFRPASTNLGITPAFRLDTGLPPFPAPPSIDPSFSNGNNTAWWNNSVTRMPENYNWTLSVQRELPGGFVLETSYNATIGAHLTSFKLRFNSLPFSVFERYGRSLLLADINSSAAIAAGIRKPYASFTGSVAQALRPYPQYLDIDTGGGNGDRTGHSTYHAGVIKLEKRFAAGLTLQSSYVFAKLIGDSDYYGSGNTGSIDPSNLRLEKSISGLDQTHNLKVNYIYELPFGKGKRWLNGGVGGAILGGWRLSGVHQYASGLPLSFSNGVAFPIFSGRGGIIVNNGYEGWIADNGDNPDWRGAARYFQPRAFFGSQPDTVLPNSTRFNPRARQPWIINENFSLAKSIFFTESIKLDFRIEAFNAFNRVRFNPGTTNISNPNFGVVNSTLNEPRRLQFGLKLYF
ncbi:MAG: carboxypeptidase regulatory-like domain-containing protein [Acidobacteria bacterium]|nr:carboxypeptidase regulatory-like domain-containing protein [Acidobacteriota bacterium]